MIHRCFGNFKVLNWTYFKISEKNICAVMKTDRSVHLQSLFLKKSLNSNNSLKLSSIRKVLKPFFKAI